MAQGDDGRMLPLKPPASHPTSLYLPLKLALLWLGGTFMLFMLYGDAGEVTNMGTLLIFISATLALFTAGYIAQIRSSGAHTPVVAEPTSFAHGEVRAARRWVISGSLYYLIFGLSSMANYGLLSPSGLVQAVLNPGASYFIRLRAAENLAATGATSALTQLLTLSSALATPVVPFLILYWSGRLGFAVRLLAFVGLSAYAAYWLAIGTLKGLGDILAFASAALLIQAVGGWPRSHRRVDRKQVIAAGLLAATFVGYMVINQGQRLEAGRASSAFQANPTITSVIGTEAARGLNVTISYPTHGYLGLAKNLETPFRWSGLRGSSRALDSYIAQYLGSPSVYDKTYPARTEQRTGYPALMYWATIYPWLASDFTFPGAALLMGLLGWWVAKLWVEAAFLRRRISVLLFSQLALLVFYIPANNQIGLMRPSLIAFMTLLGVYAMAAIHRRLGSRLGPTRRQLTAPPSGGSPVNEGQ